jgi:pimeloyl-ACP methyl ester carboxylesterase
VFTPVLAKHSKSFSLIDCISVGVDRMQRNFEATRKQVEAWQRSELTDVTAKVIIYLLQEPVYQGRDWILIGHSMGGLVCRVANCILRDQDFSSKALPLARSLGYASAEILEIQQYQFWRTLGAARERSSDTCNPEFGSVAPGAGQRCRRSHTEDAEHFPANANLLLARRLNGSRPSCLGTHIL